MIVRVNQFFTNLLETTTMRMRSCHNFGTIEDTNTIEALTHGGVNVTHSDLQQTPEFLCHHGFQQTH